MKSQPCFLSQRLKTGNPNLAIPWNRYRHGCDPPGDFSDFLPPPLSLDGEHFPLACPSNLFSYSLITKQLITFEPFLNSFRQTIATQHEYVEPSNMGIETERNG